MMDFSKAEGRLWRKDATAYEELTHEDCIMVFVPVGISERGLIVESTRIVSRASSGTVSDRERSRDMGRG
ncbi:MULTISPECIES: hypothetical protein [Ciceribacter]|uniref:Uncharacterized protein n=1 Tax=Ciceribacter lividus TaxID=1197950 RepID=A0A6I7HR66_9HYPH|nr:MULTISPECIES: hypothetical protein [Ciceribacter]MCO6178935.1 hypothetical protein [Ciceribacter sp. RN22]RCW28196.1 hypothetical protein DFR48_101205 [Ciceribacter lividus]